MAPPRMTRGACVALLLLCCVARSSATPTGAPPSPPSPPAPCLGHRNVINGTSTSEAVSDFTEGDVHIHGCGNVVSGNVLPSTDMVEVLGSDNVVRPNHAFVTDSSAATVKFKPRQLADR